MHRLAIGLTAVLLASAPARAAGIAITLTLPDPGQWQAASYTCEGSEDRFEVDYINAAPNFLAIVPIEGKSLIFASTLSGSGVRYVADHFEWWTKGADAFLRDLQADPDAPPLLTCIEARDIP